MSTSPFQLSGRSALVTGGSKGIGLAIAAEFAKAGADVMICSRGRQRLDEAAGALRAIAPGVKIEALVADMAQRPEANRLAAEALARLGKVDILVNNAGWNIPQAIDQIKDEDWDYCVELNLNNVMALTRAIVPGMKERGWGRVIHISSVMGLGSTAERNVYSATKAALVGMCRATALDLGPFGITVNCIAPGPIATEMPMSILSKEQQDSFSRRTALGRWGRPEEIAFPALLLASDAGSYITGSVIVVDGGVLANVF